VISTHGNSRSWMSAAEFDRERANVAISAVCPARDAIARSKIDVVCRV